MLAAKCVQFGEIAKVWNNSKLANVYGKIGYVDDGSGTAKKTNGWHWVSRLVEFVSNGESTFDESVTIKDDIAKKVIRQIKHEEKQLWVHKLNSKYRPMIGTLDGSIFGREITNIFMQTADRYRHNVATYATDISVINDYLYNAMETVYGMKKGEIKKTIREISDLQQAIIKGEAFKKMNDDKNISGELALNKKKLIKILSKNKKVFDQLRKYLEGNLTYNKANETFFDKESGIKIDKSVIALGDRLKKFYKDFGKIGISAVKKHTDSIKNMINNRSKDLHLDKRGLTVRLEIMNDKLEQLEKKIDDGNYMPHYLLEDLGLVVEKIDNIFGLQFDKMDNNTLSSAISEVSRFVDDIGNADSFKERVNEDRMILANPLSIAIKYGSEMAEYNYDVFLKGMLSDSFMKLDKLNVPQIRSIIDYTIDRYEVATTGYKKRSATTNKYIRLLGAMEFLQNVANFSTAFQNASQMKDFIVTTGFGRYVNSKKLLSEGDIADMVVDIEKQHGFQFSPEANFEGMMPELGKITSVDLDLVSGKVKIMTGNGPVVTTVNKLLQYHPGSKMFQFTERITRREIFRSSVATALNGLRMGGMQIEGKDRTKAIAIATRVGLRNVADNAFDYGVYNKPAIMGGTTKEMGALGQIFFRFKFYRLSQFDKLLRAGEQASIEGLRSRHFNALMGISASYMFSMALMGVVGMNFNNFFGQDTLETITDVIRNVGTPEDLNSGYGIGGEVLPVDVSQLYHLGELLGLYHLPDNELAAAVMGRNNMNYAEKDRTAKWLRFLNVNVAKFYQDWDRGFGAYSILRNMGITYTPEAAEYHKTFQEQGIIGGHKRDKKKPTRKQQPQLYDAHGRLKELAGLVGKLY